MQETIDYVELTVTLPICLHLNETEFFIKYKRDTSIKIVNKIIHSEESTPLGTGTNVEVLSDSFSHFRFTQLIITIPNFDTALSEDSELFTVFEKPFFMAVNKFIDSCRIALKRYGIKNYYSYSEFHQAVYIKTPKSTLVMNLMPGQGITMSQPFRTLEEHNQVQTLLSDGAPLFKVFLAEARKELYHFNLLHAHLNAVIALEIRVSETIRRIGEIKGIETSSISQFIKDVGLTGNIKTTLKLISPDSTVYPQDEVFERCKSAITFRNKIMHEGKRDLSLGEVEKSLENIEIMVDFCGEVLNIV